MKNFSLYSLATIVISVIALANNAMATPVTSLTGTKITIPVTNTFSGGPINVTPNITWSSTTSHSVFGYSNGYGFSSNGFWTKGLSMVGSNSPGDTMTFSFLAPVAGFGGFLNYAPNSGSTPIISTFDATHTLIESTKLTFRTDRSTNSGEFLGFLDANADISSFTLQGSYIGGANFNVVNATVPEPTSIALLGLGLLGFAASRRKASKSKNA